MITISTKNSNGDPVIVTYYRQFLPDIASGTYRIVAISRDATAMLWLHCWQPRQLKYHTGHALFEGAGAEHEVDSLIGAISQALHDNQLPNPLADRMVVGACPRLGEWANRHPGVIH